MKQAFKNRVAIITGGARGMGAAAAKHILKAGGAVSIWDINAKALDKTVERLTPYGAVTSQCVDISDYAAVDAAMTADVLAHGKLDILVNSAGIAGVNALVEDFPIDVWHQVMNVNLGGVFNTCRAAVPHMRANGYGRIINVASVAGKEGNPNASAYSASKAGVIALTKSLGKELAPSNICVNAITPAVIKTEMLDDVTPEQINYMTAKIPMGRVGTVEEVAHMIGFLASQHCSFSTAAVFDMTGGRATY